MKNLILILTMSGLIILAGCKKKEEPKTPQTMDMSNTVEKTTEQAQKTADETQKTAKTAAAAVTEQTTCPVLEGNPIDKNIFVEYKGKKVYFCCQACVSEFNKDPEKYIKDLPQFKQ